MHRVAWLLIGRARDGLRNLRSPCFKPTASPPPGGATIDDCAVAANPNNSGNYSTIAPVKKSPKLPTPGCISCFGLQANSNVA